MARKAKPRHTKSTGTGEQVGFFIPLPPRLAYQIPSLAPRDLSYPHVTFLQVGRVQQHRVGEFLEVSRSLLQRFQGPCCATLGYVDYFETETGRVFHSKVSLSPGLYEMKQIFREGLEDSGFSVSDPFTRFHPHVTLEYADQYATRASCEGPRGSWDFDTIEIWGLPEIYNIPLVSRPRNRGCPIGACTPRRGM